MKMIILLFTIFYIFSPRSFAQEHSLREMREIERNFEQILQDLNNEVNNTTSEPLRLAHEDFKDELNQCPSIDDLLESELDIADKLIIAQEELSAHVEEHGDLSNARSVFGQQWLERIRIEEMVDSYGEDVRLTQAFDNLIENSERIPPEVIDSFGFEFHMRLEDRTLRIRGEEDLQKLTSNGVTPELAGKVLGDLVRRSRRNLNVSINFLLQALANPYQHGRDTNSGWMIHDVYGGAPEGEFAELENRGIRLDLRYTHPFDNSSEAIKFLADRWPAFRNEVRRSRLLDEANSSIENLRLMENRFHVASDLNYQALRREQLQESIAQLQNSRQAIRECRNDLISIYDSLQRSPHLWSSIQGVAELEESQSALRGVREAFEMD